MRRLIVVGLVLLVGLQFSMAQDFSATPRRVAQISYSPDGNQLAVAAGTLLHDPEGDQNSLFLVDPVSGQVNIQFKWTIRFIYGFNWSPDGQWIAYVHPTIKLPRMRPGVGKNGSPSLTPPTTFSVAVSACWG